MQNTRWGVGVLAAACVLIAMWATPRQANDEGAKCANNKCKVIKYYYNCDPVNGGGRAQKFDSCVMCKQPGMFPIAGRCDGGTADDCTETVVQNRLALTDVTNTCDCPPNALGAGGNVEATGNYTGEYDIDTEVYKVYSCVAVS